MREGDSNDRPAEHTASLQDGRTVYIDGALTGDVTEYSAFRNSIETAAGLYDFQAGRAHA